MDLHCSFYDLYSQYLFDNFECYNACVLDQDISKHFQELANFGELRDGHSVVDMGCGNGQFLNFLDKQFDNIQTLGVDPSKKQITIARNHAKGSSYQNDDCATFKPTQKYDRIFFNESIGYNKESQHQLLHRYQAMLKAEGLLVIGTFINPTSLLGLNFDKINRNYKQIFQKQGRGLWDLIIVSALCEYYRMDFSYIKKHFEYSVFKGHKAVQKKWLTKRPDIRYTLFLEQELLDSHILFKIYGPKEKT